MQSILPEILPANGEDTIGPYYPIPFLDEESEDLTIVHPGLCVEVAGKPIDLSLRLRDSHFNLVDGALIEFWQANTKGILSIPQNFDHPDYDPRFTGFYRQRSNTGHFKVRTIMPGRIELTGSPHQYRAPHITLNIFCDGITRVVTQIFFEDHSENLQDPLLASLETQLAKRLIAKRVGESNQVSAFEIDIVLQGENETPFFDDLQPIAKIK
ncbi:hypothetical protein [Aliikangiella maris]|uniref:Uncharacterized protein n=2 Tax=Aliikangiella maris TaxID=3162458 RepID=A0ABV2BSF8_9GAMM